MKETIVKEANEKLLVSPALLISCPVMPVLIELGDS